MNTVALMEWIERLVIIFIAGLVAWEKAKKWHYSKPGKDRRSSNPNLESKVTKLGQAFKDHEQYDKERCERIEAEMRHIHEEQGRHTVSIEVLKTRMNMK